MKEFLPLIILGMAIAIGLTVLYSIWPYLLGFLVILGGLQVFFAYLRYHNREA